MFARTWWPRIRFSAFPAPRKMNMDDDGIFQSQSPTEADRWFRNRRYRSDRPVVHPVSKKLRPMLGTHDSPSHARFTCESREYGTTQIRPAATRSGTFDTEDSSSRTATSRRGKLQGNNHSMWRTELKYRIICTQFVKYRVESLRTIICNVGDDRNGKWVAIDHTWCDFWCRSIRTRGNCISPVTVHFSLLLPTSATIFSGGR